MKKTLLLCAPFLAVLLILSACSASKSLTVKTEDGYMLRYQSVMPGNLSYSTVNDMLQMISTEMMDIEVDVKSSTAFTILSGEDNDEKVELQLRLDSMRFITSSMQGSMDADFPELQGKTFPLVINGLGEELDYSGAKELTYTLEGAEHSLSSVFMAIFADMPEKRVQVGDTWETKDTLEYSDAAEEVLMVMDSENTFAGLEEYMGYQCARIEYTGTSSREVEGVTQGMQMYQDGIMEYSGTLYFAYEKGFLVEDSMEGEMDGNVEIQTPQGPMRMPFTMEMTMRTGIKK